MTPQTQAQSRSYEWCLSRVEYIAGACPDGGGPLCSAVLEDEIEKAGWKERFGVYGDVPTRFLMRGLESAPWFVEPVLLAMWTAIIFAAAGEQRRAVCGNLRALFPGWSWLRVGFGVYRVFWNFAATYVDALRCETKTGDVDWVIEGLDSFEKLAGAGKGCLILTAHMGNYDMAAPLFASKFGRTVYAVRSPERDPVGQDTP